MKLLLTCLILSNLAWATPGLPREARFLFDPAGDVVTAMLGEISFQNIKMPRCVTIDAKSSYASLAEYDGEPVSLTVGGQRYQLEKAGLSFVFKAAGCPLDLEKISALSLPFRNEALPSYRARIHFRPKSRDIDWEAGGASTGGSAVSFY